jgi:hypothetical protein
MAYTDHLSEDEKEGIKKFIREYEELFVTEERLGNWFKWMMIQLKDEMEGKNSDG